MLALAAASYYFLGRDGVHPVIPSLKLPLKAATPTAFGWPAQATPYAGGAAGFADGALAQARFADPYGVAVDHDGTLYASDGGDNNRIRKIAPNGAVSTLAGGKEGFADGAGGAAAFNTPSGVALDSAGNLYVADTGNHAIRKVTPQGVVSTLAGDGQAGDRDGAAAQARFNGPLGVAVDGHGNVYVADTYNDRIRMISPQGQVTTLAGGELPGYRDGAGKEALFDTPCAIAVGVHGEVLVADTWNNAIRVVRDGQQGVQVSTLVRSDPQDREALFKRPLALTVTADGYAYVATMAHGRIFQISPGGELRGLTGVDIDFARGDSSMLRLVQPSGIALEPDGSLMVADMDAYALRKVVPKSAASAAAIPALPPLPPLPDAKAASFPWPFKPQNAPREIVGTLGEVRGNDDGESRDHFHAGLDVQAAMGTPVLAVANGKVSDPLATWGYGQLSEGLSIGEMSYIHMRVGRSLKDEALEAGEPSRLSSRFILLKDADGKPRVRVRRGTRFAAGDVLGSVNRMFHTHLEYHPGGAASNPLALGLGGYRDSVAPHIESIHLLDSNGKPVGKVVGKHGKRRLLVPAGSGPLSIVVDAYDQIDGDAARRRLGLYKLGYQILHADGTPLPGYEQPLVNIEFNRLPPDRDSVKIAYAEGSGETVHGSAATHFLYVVTNTVRDGMAKAGSWHADSLPRGDYIVRIFASDYAGNQATAGRDLALTLE